MNIFHYLLRKDIVENFKLESSFLSQDIKEKELFLEHNRQYLLEEGNYIKYALMKNDRSIIDWAEQQIKLQRVKNAFSEVLKKNKM